VLLQSIVTHAVELLSTDGAFIYLYDTMRGDLELVVARGQNRMPLGWRLALGEGLAGRIAAAFQPLIIDDYDAWEGRVPTGIPLRVYGALGVPMLYGGELIGVLGVSEATNPSRKFTNDDARLLTVFAAQAAAAVRDARSVDETRRRVSDLEAVSRISDTLRAARTQDEMLSSLLDETLNALHTTAGAYWAYDPASGQLHRAASRGWFNQIIPLPIQPGEGILGYIYTTGETVVTREVRGDQRGIQGGVPPGWGGAGVPIRTAEETVGVLFIAVELPREVQLTEMSLLNTVSAITGNALHRMRLHEQTERRLRRLSALHQVDLAITTNLDFTATLIRLLEQVIEHLNVDAADILIYKPHLHRLEFAAGCGFHSRAIERTLVWLGEGPAGRTALEGRPLHIPNLADAPREFARALLLAGENFVAYHSVPLVVKGRVKGVLEIFHRSALHTDTEWIEFLDALATPAAIAIDSAELFQGLQRSNAELAQAYEATLEGWVRALDLRDRETQGHTRRVTEMTERLARAMNVGESEMAHIRRGALLHDIGKIAIPDNILLKPAPLTDDEWVIMRQHPTYAFNLLSPIEFLHPALDIPYSHHEKWDGTGYPRQLKGEAIPLSARIFSMVDVWDALYSDRPYRKGWSLDKVNAYIREQAGHHFDPLVVEAFMKLPGSPHL
jgi:HD-GYP domain-containing protein (c-di-GMP phosphodiesterase class II)/putative methionine-R-sulfoxide reductase with GAF domain